MAEQFVNFYEAVLQKSIDSGATTLELTPSAVSKLPSLSSDTIRLVIYDGEQEPEVLIASAKNSPQVTVSRGNEGTTARSWAAGSKIRAAVTAQQLSDLFASLGSVNSVSGDLVGTTGAQTLEDKTLESPDINSPDIDGGTIDNLDSPLGVLSGGTGATTPAQARSNLGITGTVSVNANSATLSQNQEVRVSTPGISLADRFKKRLVQVLEEDTSGGQAVEDRLDMDAGDLSQWALEDYAPSSDLEISERADESENAFKIDYTGFSKQYPFGLIWVNTERFIMGNGDNDAVDNLNIDLAELQDFRRRKAFATTDTKVIQIARLNVSNTSGYTTSQNDNTMAPVDYGAATTRFLTTIVNGNNEFEVLLLEYNSSTDTLNELARKNPTAFSQGSGPEFIRLSDSEFVLALLDEGTSPATLEYAVFTVSSSTLTLEKDTSTFTLDYDGVGFRLAAEALSNTRAALGWIEADGGNAGGAAVEVVDFDTSYNITSFASARLRYNTSTFGTIPFAIIGNSNNDTHFAVFVDENDNGTVNGYVELCDCSGGTIGVTTKESLGLDWAAVTFSNQPLAYVDDTHRGAKFDFAGIGFDHQIVCIDWNGTGTDFTTRNITLNINQSFNDLPIVPNPSGEFHIEPDWSDNNDYWLIGYDVNDNPEEWSIAVDQGYDLTLSSGYWDGEDVNRTVVGDAGEVLITKLVQDATGGAPTSSSGTAGNAFDGDSGTVCSQSSADGWIGYDFGSAQTVRAFGLWSNVTRTYDLVVEVSDDNFSTTNQVMDVPASSFPANNYLWFTISSPQSARYIRVRETGGATLEVIELVFNFGLDAEAKLALSDFSSTSTISSGDWELSELVHYADGRLYSTKTAAVAVLGTPIDSSLWDSLDSISFTLSLVSNADLPVCFSFDERTYRIWDGSAAYDIASDDNSVHGNTDGVWHYRDSGGSWVAASSDDIWTALREAMQVGNNVTDYTVYEGLSTSDWSTFGWTKSTSSIVDLAMLFVDRNFVVNADETLSSGDNVDQIDFTYTTRSIWRQVDPGDYDIDLELPSEVRVEKLSSGTRDVRVAVWSV